MQEETPQTIEPPVSPNQDLTPPPPPAAEIVDKTHKKKKYIIAFIILLLIAVGGTAAYFVFVKKSNENGSAPTLPELSASTEPKLKNKQYNSEFLSTGYVKYNAEKLKASDIKLVNIESILPSGEVKGESQTLFITGNEYAGKSLILYDLSTKEAYVVAEDSNIDGYSHVSIMSNHYVVYVVESHTDPVSYFTTIKITDLNTGETRTIMEGKSADLPTTICCAVSPDGLRLVVPQTDKFLVYQAGDEKPVIFPVNVQIFPKTVGEDNDDYAASHRNYGYPPPVWIDNNRIMFAKHHPLSYTVKTGEDWGSYEAPDANGLSIFDLSNGSTNDIDGISDQAIKWFVVDGPQLIFAAYKKLIDHKFTYEGREYNNRHISGISIYKITDYPKSTKLIRLLEYKYDDSGLFYSDSSKRIYVSYSPDDAHNTIQTVDVKTSKTGSFDPNLPSGYKGLYPTGLIGPDKILLSQSGGSRRAYFYDVSAKELVRIWPPTPDGTDPVDYDPCEDYPASCDEEQLQ